MCKTTSSYVSANRTNCGRRRLDRVAGPGWRDSVLLLLGIAALAASCLAGCGAGQTNGDDGGLDGRDGSITDNSAVHGRLATSATGLRNRTTRDGSPSHSLGTIGQALSFDQVSVDLLQPDGTPQPENWPVVGSATPDASGTFAFEGLAEGDYALKVNQPEFADLAYRVDTTEFHLGADQTVNLVLPLVTTLIHNLMDPSVVWNPISDSPPAAALDPATGEIVLTSNLGFAVVDPDRGKLDLLFSHNFFIGHQQKLDFLDQRVLALSPFGQIAWILYPDRLVRIDRSLFSDPDQSEVFNLDDLANRVAVGDKFRYRILAPLSAGPNPRYPTWTGEVYFSPDETILYASTRDDGVFVFDLERMKLVRVIIGHLIGYNPISNHLFFTNSHYGQHDGTDVLVVDASTLLEVNSAPLQSVVGVAPVPGQPDTFLIRSQLSTGDMEVPFVVVVDGSGAVATDQRARDYLGIDYDPQVGSPSFDLTGDYFMIGSAAFRVLAEGGFEPVPVAIPPGESFNQRMQCNQLRAVDPANLYELWYGCLQANAVGLISLDQTNLPVAVRPSVPTDRVLLDRVRGRAIFSGFDRLVLVHYADPSAAEQDELTDLSGVLSDLTAPGAVCSEANPCGGSDLCAGATDTAYTGNCTPNPRLPYLPFCGGFTHMSCDGGFICALLNPTNPNSIGYCSGFADRDYTAHGSACGPDSACPVGMTCGAASHCEPKTCLRDQDCAAIPGEICGLVEIIGRACLLPGELPDGAACLGPEECQHGTCVALASGWAMGADALLDGAFGLMVCSTPCFQNSDCPGADQCEFFGPPRNTTFSPTGEAVWQTHRDQIMPYCRPAVLPPPTDCAGGCTSSELCATGHLPTPRCQVGFEPWVLVENGDQTSCLPPAELNSSPGNPVVCSYRCRRSGDCPFETDCASGFCSVFDSRCDLTCAADESCAWFGWAESPGVCINVDACATDADCGGDVGSCIGDGACLGDATCLTSADCLDEECAAGHSYGLPRYCLPPECGCTGPQADEMFCNLADSTCYLPGWCADVPCDGSVDPVCDVTPPDPLPGGCRCPSCAWDVCPTGPPVPLCPTGFTCTDIGATYAHSGHCACTSPDCQTP